MQRPDLHLLGVSYRTAPLAVREALAFDQAGAAQLLERVSRELPGLEVVVLSTCNRTEFYLSCSPDGAAVDNFLSLLRSLRPTAPILRTDCARYRLTGAPAMRHLVEVTCGLDSAILGDLQILGQTRLALATAEAAGTVGASLRQSFTRAIRAGKKARARTDIACGAASLGSALAGMLRRLVPEGRPRILIAGAGEIAEDIARHLAKRRLGELQFTNRTTAKAQALADYWGGSCFLWDRLEDALVDADIVVMATGSQQPVLTRELVARVASRKSTPFRLIVDAGVPRNVESEVPAPLMDLDSIMEARSELLARRQEAVPQVHRIVDVEVASWEAWCSAQPLEAVIKKLYVDVPLISRQAAARLTSPEVDPGQIERIVSLSIRQMLHGHVRELREEWQHATHS